MALNTEHPFYISMREDWTMMQDTYEGEKAVKVKGETYLPVLPSMVIDGIVKPTDEGSKAYERYKLRAVFWDFVSDAVEALVGMMHQKPASIKLPKAMEPLLKKASREGESLQQLLRRVNEQQLVMGRLGLLPDMPQGLTVNPVAIPYIALYNALSVINWDDSHDGIGEDILRLVVLNETSFERNAQFTWEKIEKYRVLMLASADGPSDNPLSAETGDYVTGVFKTTGGDNFNESMMLAPALKGRKLKKVPFTFINSKDVISTPDNPPLIGLARLCLAIYRGEADYRQNLFMQGQDTLVVIGGSPTSVDDPTGANTARRVGAGATIDVNLGGDAKYIGVSATGLPEQRVGLENDKVIASTKAGQLVSPQAGKQESGDALTTRVSAMTASLLQIAKTGAAGLEMALRNCAEWMGLNPDEVSVEANTEFFNRLMTAKDLSDFMDARSKGSPMSLKSIHDNMIARGMTELTFDEEIDQIVKEKTLQGAAPLIVPDPNKADPAKPAKV